MNPKVSSPISHGDSAFFSVIHARDMRTKRLSLFLYQTQNLPLFFLYTFDIPYANSVQDSCHIWVQ